MKKLLKNGDHSKLNDYLKTLSPSGIELEFLSLGNFEIADKDTNLELMFEYFLQQVKRKVDSDFNQSLLNCFLKTHYDVIIEDEDMMAKVAEIMSET